jgi:hypothetical protein
MLAAPITDNSIAKSTMILAAGRHLEDSQVKKKTNGYQKNKCQHNTQHPGKMVSFKNGIYKILAIM